MIKRRHLLLASVAALLSMPAMAVLAQTQWQIFQDQGVSLGWFPLVIGGGGFVTGGQAVGSTLLAKTDGAGFFKWNGTRWVQLITASSMPAASVQPNWGKGVRSIAIAPSDPKTFYFSYVNNVTSTPGGFPNETAIFKTSDGGNTFTDTGFPGGTLASNGNYRLSGNPGAVDPALPSLLYQADDGGGVFTYNGSSWSANITSNFTSFSGIIVAIVFEPTTSPTYGTTGGKSNTIYAGGTGGIWKNTAAGVGTWAKIGTGTSSPSGCGKMVIDPTGRLWLIDGSGNIWYYTAAGGWVQPAGTNLEAWNAIAVNPNSFTGGTAGQVVAQGGGGSNGGAHLIQTLTANAATPSWDWTGGGAAGTITVSDYPWLGQNSGVPFVTGDLQFDPTQSNKLIAFMGVGVMWTTLPSSFGGSPAGVTWTSMTLGIENTNGLSLAAPGGLSARFPTMWDRTGAAKDANSLNTPPTQTLVNVGHTDAGRHVDWASGAPSTLAIILDDGLASTSTAAEGTQWSTITLGTPNPQTVGGSGGTIALADATHWVWAAANAVAIAPYYTADGGSTWTPCAIPGIPGPGSSSITGGPYFSGATSVTVADGTRYQAGCLVSNTTYNGNQTVTVSGVSGNTLTVTVPAANGTNITASFNTTGGGQMVVTAIGAGFIGINDTIHGTGITDAKVLSQVGSYTGGVGTYNMSVSQTVGSTTGLASDAVWYSGDNLQPVTGYPSSSFTPRWTTCADRVNIGTIYTIALPGNAANGVYRSTNNGANFTKIFNGAPSSGDSSGTGGMLKSVPGKANHIFNCAGGSTLQSCFNAGAALGTVAFNTVPTPGGSTNVWGFGFGAIMPGNDYPTVYLVAGTGANYNVYRSTSSSANWLANTPTWTAIGLPLNCLDTIVNIEGDSLVWNICYTALGGQGFAYHRG